MQDLFFGISAIFVVPAASLIAAYFIARAAETKILVGHNKWVKWIGTIVVLLGTFVIVITSSYMLLSFLGADFSR